MRPSDSQTAPNGCAASVSAIGSPPASATFLSFPAAKKPTHRPSGEKNGAAPSSVPGSARPSSSSSLRTYRRHAVSHADHATTAPSGATASDGARASKTVPCAGAIRIRTTGANEVPRWVYRHSAVAARIAQSSAALHGTSPLPIDGDTFSATTAASGANGPAGAGGFESLSGATNR